MNTIYVVGCHRCHRYKNLTDLDSRERQKAVGQFILGHMGHDIDFVCNAYVLLGKDLDLFETISAYKEEKDV